MPVYEYQCESCGHSLRKLQKRQDPAPTTCPNCDAKDTLQRLFSRASFHLKGGGWYDSGYASTAEQKAQSSSDAPPKSEASSDSTTSTESSTASSSTSSSVKESTPSAPSKTESSDS